LTIEAILNGTAESQTHYAGAVETRIFANNVWAALSDESEKLAHEQWALRVDNALAYFLNNIPLAVTGVVFNAAIFIYRLALNPDIMPCVGTYANLVSNLNSGFFALKMVDETTIEVYTKNGIQAPIDGIVLMESYEGVYLDIHIAKFDSFTDALMYRMLHE
jgi:hypothetical protein